ncbi:MAG TPA: ATP-binding protein [Acidimicrobiales bacterium]
MSLSLELPRERESVPLARHLASRSLLELGVLDEIVDDMEIALSEVCTNVIDHAEVGDSYDVEIFVKGHDCEIRVVDSGLGFDAIALADSGPETDFERGRGLAIVRAVMDHVDLQSHTDRGTLVTLEKHLEFKFEISAW